MGFGECGDVSFGKGNDDYELDEDTLCQNEGYNITSCTIPSYLYEQCPYSSKYYKSCKKDADKACKDAGYVSSCPDGYVKDETQVCPYSDSYYKCKCNPCNGYTYTLTEATAQGYVTDGSCNSCGTTKYKRKENPCSGYLTCECGGEIGTPTCKSGSITKYQTCKTCCEYKCSETTCPDGYICEKETCSNKYCITGCAVDYTDWCTAPITDCGALGYTKTADQCPSGYLKCPYGETVFCPTETKCTIGDIYYSDNTCLPADKHDSTKTVLGVVVYITDSGKHGQIMAFQSGLGSKEWGGYGTDMPSLTNYTSGSIAATDYDSCGNTDKIIAAGDASTYPAAWAARKYAPTPETAGKWCLPAGGILGYIADNHQIFNSTLEILGYSLGALTWSSTEASALTAFYSRLDNNTLVGSSKYNIVGIRPVLEF